MAVRQESLTAFGPGVAGGADAGLLGDGFGRRLAGLGPHAARVPGQAHGLRARARAARVRRALQAFELGAWTYGGTHSL